MGKGSLGWSRPGCTRRKEKTGEKKKGENNKAPVGAYILGKNCRGRKRMRGNRRGEEQDDGNLPADILCVSCERTRFPTSTYTHTSFSFLLSPAFVPPRIPLSPFICFLGFFWLGSIDYHEIRGEETNGSFSRVSPSKARYINKLSQIKFFLTVQFDDCKK